jgi:hypothetical protein
MHLEAARIPPLLRNQVRSFEAVQHISVTSKRPHCDGNKKRLRSMSNAAPSDAATYKGLLSAAREVFTRKGYSATSVREIVAAAGVTRPVLYYYFRNKEGIYLELLREPFAKLAVGGGM